MQLSVNVIVRIKVTPPKEILSLSDRGLAELYGVVGTMVVAGHTIGTVAVPKWSQTLCHTVSGVGIIARHSDIAQRT